MAVISNENRAGIGNHVLANLISVATHENGFHLVPLNFLKIIANQ